MEYSNENFEELLEYINPAMLDYQEWVNVGMALKESGYDVSVWDNWSAQDAERYHQGECEKKWNSFNGNENPVTAGTLVFMAKENGWTPMKKVRNKALDWDDVIFTNDDYLFTSPEQTNAVPVLEPENWNPVQEITKYLETLFETNDFVGYVTQTWQNSDEKFVPSKGVYTRTAGQILEELKKYQDIESVFGTVKPESGAWIRFNPLDGKGVKNVNVTDFRYALVESDTGAIETHISIMHDLKLPIACMVHSGNKSVHAIVKIHAGSYEEYRKRVDFLYNICDKNGLKVDRQNRNPSRLSRMPGVIRGDKKQFLIETNTGFASFEEWKDFIEESVDDLPEFENFADISSNMPELSPFLIQDVLRQGHKMLIAGASKTGKSFLLIELCIAIAEGSKWLNWNCAKGKVLYVNLELDKASCAHRFQDVYQKLKASLDSQKNIDIWNLRGVSEPMNKLVPKLVRRAKKKGYIAIIIDPIYKVITGDENSAEQMADFCNQFDKICNQLNCAVIYCHHHSKGSQWGKKSVDRASGSGVFARDPDAFLDLTELDLKGDVLIQQEHEAVCRTYNQFIRNISEKLYQEIPIDDTLNRIALEDFCRQNLSAEQNQELKKQIQSAEQSARKQTALRLEGTLREFAPFAPVNLWFRYPVHEVDKSGILQDIKTDADLPLREYGAKKGHETQSKQAKSDNANKRIGILNTFNSVAVNGEADLSMIASLMGMTEKTVRRQLKNSKNLEIKDGK
ncbi:MAG: AAA family ATPase, partial [Oscillospiraceae bacterium]|nr:AAA family ATPase [Oscillospiraceae bacterium]